MEKPKYFTYGALARPAMFMGIPVNAFAMTIIAFALLTLLGLVMFDIKGLLILLLSAPILLLFRTLCENDDQALNIIGFELLCSFKKRNARFFNKTFTVLSERQENVHDFTKQFQLYQSRVKKYDSY